MPLFKYQKNWFGFLLKDGSFICSDCAMSEEISANSVERIVEKENLVAICKSCNEPIDCGHQDNVDDK